MSTDFKSLLNLDSTLFNLTSPCYSVRTVFNSFCSTIYTSSSYITSSNKYLSYHINI